MKLGNYIDIAITVFLIFSLVMGYRNGLIKSLFISFGFLIKIGLTYMVYTFFKDALLSNDSVKELIGMIRAKPCADNISGRQCNIGSADFYNCINIYAPALPYAQRSDESRYAFA